MEIQKAFDIANANPPPSFARFYGPAAGAAIGAGVVLTNVEYPIYLTDQERYGILRGLVIVLSHECDLDPANDRNFNESALVCPILSFESVLDTLSNVFDESALGTYLRNITSRNVNRLVYVPGIADILPYGGYLYLNLMTSTHISKLSGPGIEKVCMLSADGLREMDFALERHLRRPKSDRVPLQTTFGFLT